MVYTYVQNLANSEGFVKVLYVRHISIYVMRSLKKDLLSMYLFVRCV